MHQRPSAALGAKDDIESFVPAVPHSSRAESAAFLCCEKARSSPQLKAELATAPRGTSSELRTGEITRRRFDPFNGALAGSERQVTPVEARSAWSK